MSIQYYLRENKLKLGKKYFAQTVPNQIIDEKSLVEYMAGKNAGMTSTELNGVLDLLKLSLKELLTKGNRIVLSDTLSIFPVIKASFDTSKEGFNHSSNSINVRCKVSRVLKNEIRKTAVVEKHSSNGIAPKLSDVISGKKEENIIRWPYSTTMSGKNLNPWKQLNKGCDKY